MAADLLNDRVLPFYVSKELPVLRILTDRGAEYCGKADSHDYQLYLAINVLICTRKVYSTIDDLQKDLDGWLEYYNNERTHQGKMCCGRTLMGTLLDGKKIWQEKNMSELHLTNEAGKN